MRRKVLSIFILIILFTTVNIFAEEIKPVEKKEFFIIANKSVTFDSITYSELKDLYMGRNRKVRGEYLLPAMYSDCDCFDVFLKNILGLNKREFDVIWKKAIFTGRGKPPKIFRNMNELVNYVVMTRNTIGIVDKEHLSEDVKVLEVLDHLTSSETPKEEKIEKTENQG